MNDNEFEKMLNEANEAIDNETISADKIVLTKKAASRIKKFLKDEAYLRIKVVPGGCAGFSYEFEAEKEEPGENDHIVEQDGTKIILDKESYDMLLGSKIDFVETMESAGFRIINPNATSSCGCGQSFR